MESLSFKLNNIEKIQLINKSKKTKVSIVFITPLGTDSSFFINPIAFFKQIYNCTIVEGDNLVDLVLYCNDVDRIRDIFTREIGKDFLNRDTFIISFCSSAVIGAVLAKNFSMIRSIFINGSFFLSKDKYSQHEIDTFNIALEDEETISAVYDFVRKNNFEKLNSNDVIEYNKVLVYSRLDIYIKYLRNIKSLCDFSFLNKIDIVISKNLFIQSSNDEITNNKYPYYFEDNFPNSKIVMMKNSGHYDFIYGSVTIFDQIQSFIEGDSNEKK